MNASWKRFSLVLVVAILTITSFATLVHRHAGMDDPGCVLCHGRYERAIDNPVRAALPVPVLAERNLETAEVRPISREPVFDRFVRGPPTPSFAS